MLRVKTAEEIILGGEKKKLILAKLIMTTRRAKSLKEQNSLKNSLLTFAVTAVVLISSAQNKVRKLLIFYL